MVEREEIENRANIRVANGARVSDLRQKKLHRARVAAHFRMKGLQRDLAKLLVLREENRTHASRAEPFEDTEASAQNVARANFGKRGWRAIRKAVHRVRNREQP